MKSCFFSVTAFAIALLSTPTSAQTMIIGLGHAKDGDSLTVGDRDVRLFGVDAPEFDQTCSSEGHSWGCGAAAADALMDLVTGKEVECSSMGKEQYGRILGRCTAGGIDVNRSMVAGGYAVAYRRYSSAYVAAEESAKASRAGIWAGNFELPEQFRRTGGSSAAPRPTSRRLSEPKRGVRADRPQDGCNIKGNRNWRGEWIYHLPGMPYYDQTRPEEIFCTEAEAQAAGYRRAIVR